MCRGMRLRRTSASFLVLLAVCAVAVLVEGCCSERLGLQPTGPLPGQIVSDPENPFWLVRYDPAGNHRPLFLCGPGDPEGLLFSDSAEPAEQVLRQMKAHGGNTIYVIAVRSHGGDGDETQNPFIDHDPMKGVDRAVLDRWDKILRPFDEAEIAIHFFLYDDSAVPFGKYLEEIPPQEQAFVTAIVERFRDYRNIIWNISEEYRECMTPAHAARLGRLIAAVDLRGHVVGISQNPGRTFEHAGDPHLKLWHVQSDCTSASNAHEIAVQIATEAWGKYHATYSEVYQYGYELMRANDRTALRDLNWAIGMAGLYVMHGGIWLADWQPDPLPGILSDMRRVQVLMESIPDLTHHASADGLAAGSTMYVLAAGTTSFIAYTYDATAPMGLADLPAGTYTLRWFDCVRTEEVRSRYRHEQPGTALWRKPAGLGNEVALCVRVL
jgi:hypothetical protein